MAGEVRTERRRVPGVEELPQELVAPPGQLVRPLATRAFGLLVFQRGRRALGPALHQFQIHVAAARRTAQALQGLAVLRNAGAGARRGAAHGFGLSSSAAAASHARGAYALRGDGSGKPGSGGGAAGASRGTSAETVSGMDRGTAEDRSGESTGATPKLTHQRSAGGAVGGTGGHGGGASPGLAHPESAGLR